MTATVIDLDAATGIGDVTPLELTGNTLSIDTTTGTIDVDNVSATAVTVTSLTTTTGDIRFDQSGGGG